MSYLKPCGEPNEERVNIIVLIAWGFQAIAIVISS